MSLVGKLLRQGIKSADDLARQVMPAIMQTGDSVLIERTTNALRKMGASVPSQPGPGLLGTRNVPTSRQLGQAPVPAFGPGAKPAAPAPGGAPGVRGVPPLAQNRPPAPLAEAPTPPVRYPEPTRGETARQITMLKPGEGEVGSMGTRLTYRPGTEGVSGRLGSTTYGQGAEIGATSAYPRMPVGSSAQDQMRLSSQLNRGASTAEMPGTPLLRTRGDNQYVAPRPAFGPGARGEILEPSPDDVLFRGGQVLDPSVSDVLFRGGSRGGGGALGRAAQGGPGGALVRSTGGEMVDELMIDPVRVREIFETSPELLAGTLRNAAGGLQTANLGSLLSDPKTLAALGLISAGGGYGLASMLAGGEQDKTGQTTAEAPGVPPVRPFFTEDGAVPLGGGADSVTPSVGTTGSSAAAAPIITSGGEQRESAVREALAQAAPGAAAVQRATEPMSPERYRSIEDYYAARQAYASNADKRRELMRFMEGQSPQLGAQLSQWAEANPTLAYEYQRRQLANPAANQQSAESITTTTITTPMGSETSANAVGNAEATGEAVVNPSQGSFEMVDATRPQIQSNLQRVQEFIQRQAPRSRMYAGY